MDATRPAQTPPDPPLGDEAIVLRPPTQADAPAVAAACADPEIGRWIPLPVPYTLADAHDFLGTAAEGWASGTDFVFAIEERAGGALAGLIDLHRGGEPGRAAVGYWLAPAARGRGLATRAVRLVAAWAFAEPALERLELVTLVGNDASGRVALRAGFRREGILRRYLDFRGAPVDVVMYAMTREDLAGDAGEAGPVDDPLVRVPIFEGLTGSEISRIRTAATEVTLEPGAVLVAEGEPGDALIAGSSGCG